MEKFFTDTFAQIEKKRQKIEYLINTNKNSLFHFRWKLFFRSDAFGYFSLFSYTGSRFKQLLSAIYFNKTDLFISIKKSSKLLSPMNLKKMWTVLDRTIEKNIEGIQNETKQNTIKPPPKQIYTPTSNENLSFTVNSQKTARGITWNERLLWNCDEEISTYLCMPLIFHTFCDKQTRTRPEILERMNIDLNSRKCTLVSN